MIYILYLTLYFGWIFYDRTDWQSLKLTGLPIPKAQAGPSAGGHEFDPGVSDEWQSTIVSWWRKRISSTEEENKILNKIIPDLEKSSNTKEIEPILNQIRIKYCKISTEYKLINESLDRFNKKFKNYCLRQIFRWFIFDGVVPLFLGFLAIIRISYILFSIG